MDIIDKFYGLIAPLECVGCGAEGDIACQSCHRTGFKPAQSACSWCGKLVQDNKTCIGCKPKIVVSNVWWPFAYNDFAKKVVSAYKFEAQRSVADFMVKEMLKVLPEHDLIVTSIPTASRRVRERGFDHATRLGKKVASSRRLPYQRTLQRLGSSRQVGSSRQKRLKQVENLFSIRHPEIVKGQNILIVDDVMTTGATIAAASKILKRAGAKNVYALVFARK